MTGDKPTKPTLHLLGDGKSTPIRSEDIIKLYEMLTGKKATAEEISYAKEKLGSTGGSPESSAALKTT